MIFEDRAPQRPSAEVVSFRDQLEEASANAHASRSGSAPAPRAAAAPAQPAPGPAPVYDDRDWRSQPLNVPSSQQGFQPVEPARGDDQDRVRTEPLP